MSDLMIHLLCRRPFVLMCVALIGAAACDRTEEVETPAASAQTSAKTSASSKVDSDADMVAAVSSSTGQGAVALKFNLRQHPQVGQPADLELILTPTINLQRLYATFQVSEGLELRSGSEIAGQEKLEAGAPIAHRITFVPKREGIFYVSAVLVSDAQDTSTSRAYSIPVIAGGGLAPASSTVPTSTAVAAQSAVTAVQ